MHVIRLLALSLLSYSGHGQEFKAAVNDVSQAHLFEPSKEILVSAPTHFPKPTRLLNDTAVVIIEPTYGKHRPDQDVVMAYAEGYRLPYYMMFLETLTATGYRGDVVLAIADERIIKPDVLDYLMTYTTGDPDKPGLAIYQESMVCAGESGLRALTKSGETDIFQFCQLSHIYGWKDKDGNVVETAEDPREGRVVATLRYEWYWIWSQRYQPNSWIMLIDARDSYFQSNPFEGLPRGHPNQSDGLLYFFGENPDATRLGKSRKNLKWLQIGYGEATLNALKEKPTICSGSTMGEQIAIETYLRALVNEHDEADVRMTGSDQGFHNYLYYSRKLTNAAPIRKLVLWEQGRGIINNMGALRTKAFEEWGLYDPATHDVYQWDGKTLSPVVHQWDRDKDLHGWMNGKKHREWANEWASRKKEAATQ